MHPALRLLFVGAAVVCACVAAPARAAVPSAANSTVPTCLVACPLGDIPFTVVVRDLANNPVVNSVVVLDFSTCAAAYLCTVPGTQPDPYTVNLGARTITMVSDATGTANFPLRVGGVCAAGTVRVFADGVLLGTRALASPDQDGNGYVYVHVFQPQNDGTLFVPKLGTSDPTADFDCNGTVTGSDETILYAHLDHACEGVVAAKRSSWGSVKSFYR